MSKDFFSFVKFKPSKTLNTTLKDENEKVVTSFLKLKYILSQPRQRLAKVWAKSEPNNHISCFQECKRM
jgi:hypothetical protein